MRLARSVAIVLALVAGAFILSNAAPGTRLRRDGHLWDQANQANSAAWLQRPLRAMPMQCQRKRLQLGVGLLLIVQR